METAAAAGGGGRREHAGRERLLVPVRFALLRLRRHAPRTLIVALGIAVGAAVLAMTAVGSASVQDRAVQRALAQLAPSDRAIQAVWSGVPAQSSLSYPQLDRIARRATDADPRPAAVCRRRLPAVDVGRCVRQPRRRRRARPLARPPKRPAPEALRAGRLRADPDRRVAGRAEAPVPPCRRPRDVQGRRAASGLFRRRGREAAADPARRRRVDVHAHSAAGRSARRAHLRLDRPRRAALDPRLAARGPRRTPRSCAVDARAALRHLHDGRADGHDPGNPHDEPGRGRAAAHPRRRRGGAAARLRDPRLDTPPPRPPRRAAAADLVGRRALADPSCRRNRGRRHHGRREHRGLGGRHGCGRPPRAPPRLPGRARRRALDHHAARTLDRPRARGGHGRRHARGAARRLRRVRRSPRHASPTSRRSARLRRSSSRSRAARPTRRRSRRAAAPACSCCSCRASCSSCSPSRPRGSSHRCSALLEWAARRARPSVRVALLSLARAPGDVLLTVVFFVLSVGIAVFAIAYRATLVQGEHEQARYAVPAPYVLQEDLGRLVTVQEAALPSRYAATPVVRDSGSISGTRAPRLHARRAAGAGARAHRRLALRLLVADARASSARCFAQRRRRGSPGSPLTGSRLTLPFTTTGDRVGTDCDRREPPRRLHAARPRRARAGRAHAYACAVPPRGARRAASSRFASCSRSSSSYVAGHNAGEASHAVNDCIDRDASPRPASSRAGSARAACASTAPCSASSSNNAADAIVRPHEPLEGELVPVVVSPAIARAAGPSGIVRASRREQRHRREDRRDDAVLPVGRR